MDFLQTHQIELKPQAKKLATTLEALNAGGKQAVLVIFQALDAAGKDSTIRNVFRYCDPGYTHVASFKAPSKLEVAHDFMWRCYQHFPAKGQLQVFNRSYYEETLVVRVHPEFLKAQGIEQKPNKTFWKKRFDFIRQTENHLLNSGTKVIKFFLDVSQEEQHKRFIRRYSNPDKQWKFSIGDLKESQQWAKYQKAFSKMLKKTSTARAPWHIIPANDKPAMRAIVAAIIQAELESMKPKYPVMPAYHADELKLIEQLVGGDQP